MYYHFDNNRLGICTIWAIFSQTRLVTLRMIHFFKLLLLCFGQPARLVVHVVPEPDQVDPLHHLAQLQVDHHQSALLDRPRRLLGIDFTKLYFG
jgi:hypothetical protein